MNIEVIAPGATDKHRRCATAAAAMVFAIKGMSADVAKTALHTQDLDDIDVTPAQARRRPPGRG